MSTLPGDSIVALLESNVFLLSLEKLDYSQICFMLKLFR
jgi:hypothetical protein